jgi:peptide/nickel transport system permease protein
MADSLKQVITLVLRRLGFIGLVTVAIVFFCTFGLRMGVNSSASRPSYNLIRPARYAAKETVRYFKSALHGDLGYTTRGKGHSQRRVPVTTVIKDTYVKSMGLLTFALAIAATPGIVAGMLAAVRRRSPLALATLTLSILGVSTPSFFAALLLQIAGIKFIRTFHYPLVAMGGFGWDRHIILPGLVLAARPLAHLTRVTFVALSDVLEKDYIRTAYAKGLSLRAILRGHAFRNAAVTVLTAVGVSLRFSLGSLPVVEYYFGWPGMGAALLSAIRGRDTPVVVGLALCLGLTFMLVNLLLDVTYRLIDPTLRESE